MYYLHHQPINPSTHHYHIISIPIVHVLRASPLIFGIIGTGHMRNKLCSATAQSKHFVEWTYSSSSTIIFKWNTNAYSNNWNDYAGGCQWWHQTVRAKQRAKRQEISSKFPFFCRIWWRGKYKKRKRKKKQIEGLPYTYFG